MIFFLETTVIPCQLSVWYDTNDCYLILHTIYFNCKSIKSIVKIWTCIINNNRILIACDISGELLYVYYIKCKSQLYRWFFLFLFFVLTLFSIRLRLARVTRGAFCFCTVSTYFYKKKILNFNTFKYFNIKFIIKLTNFGAFFTIVTFILIIIKKLLLPLNQNNQNINAYRNFITFVNLTSTFFVFITTLLYKKL